MVNSIFFTHFHPNTHLFKEVVFWIGRAWRTGDEEASTTYWLHTPIRMRDSGHFMTELSKHDTIYGALITDFYMGLLWPQIHSELLHAPPAFNQDGLRRHLGDFVVS